MIIFIDGGVYGIFVDGLFGIIIFCIWFFFCVGIYNCVGCYCVGFDGLLVFFINDGICCNFVFMYLLFIVV